MSIYSHTTRSCTRAGEGMVPTANRTFTRTTSGSRRVRYVGSDRSEDPSMMVKLKTVLQDSGHCIIQRLMSRDTTLHRRVTSAGARDCLRRCLFDGVVSERRLVRTLSRCGGRAPVSGCATSPALSQHTLIPSTHHTHSKGLEPECIRTCRVRSCERTNEAPLHVQSTIARERQDSNQLDCLPSDVELLQPLTNRRTDRRTACLPDASGCETLPHSFSGTPCHSLESSTGTLAEVSPSLSVWILFRWCRR